MNPRQLAFVRKVNTSAPKGANHHGSKLTEDDIREIRRLWAEGVKGVTLAKRFKVGSDNISRIIHRRIWIHVK